MKRTVFNFIENFQPIGTTLELPNDMDGDGDSSIWMVSEYILSNDGFRAILTNPDSFFNKSGSIKNFLHFSKNTISTKDNNLNIGKALNKTEEKKYTSAQNRYMIDKGIPIIMNKEVVDKKVFKEHKLYEVYVIYYNGEITINIK